MNDLQGLLLFLSLFMRGLRLALFGKACDHCENYSRCSQASSVWDFGWGVRGALCLQLRGTCSYSIKSHPAIAYVYLQDEILRTPPDLSDQLYGTGRHPLRIHTSRSCQTIGQLWLMNMSLLRPATKTKGPKLPERPSEDLRRCGGFWYFGFPFQDARPVT